MRKLIALKLLALCIAGCTTFPADRTLFNQEALSKLDIAEADMQSKTKSYFGVTSLHSNMADMQLAYMIQTIDYVHFIVWNHDLKQFNNELSLQIKDIKSISLVHTGTFGHMRQIQMTSETALIVMSFTIGENHLAEGAYNKLLNAGVPVGDKTRYVRSTRDLNRIPIFIPTN